jgi:hypothetical protein
MPTSKPSLNRFRRISLSIGILLAFACGPGLFDENEFLSYFLPESSNAQSQDRRYFFTPQLYNYDSETEADTVRQSDENLNAWAAYAGGNVPITAVAKALYEGDESARNRFVTQLSRTHAPAIDYLKLALQADKASGGGDIWNPDPADTTQLTQLLGEARTKYSAVNDPFLKERYAYQAVKVADQIGDHDQCLDLYDQLITPITKKTFISDWALCRHAGAAFSLGDTARAIYEFAQVFDRCPSRRPQAEASLRIYGIRFRAEALKYAKNDREKAAVYALCAIQPKQDALPLLKELIALAPENPLVELTMAREINRNEYFFLAEQNPIYGYDETTKKDSVAFEDCRKTSVSYANQLRAFALDAAQNEKLNDPAYWYTSAAYLAYLDKDYDASITTLDKAEQAKTSNADLKKQIALQRMLLLAAQTETINSQVENQLIGYLEQFGNAKNFRFNNAFVEVCQQFARRYQQEAAGSKSGGWLSGCSRPTKDAGKKMTAAKSFLLTMLTSSQLNRSEAYVNVNSDQLVIEDSTSAATVQQAVAFSQQPNPTDFDKRLLKLTGFDADYLNTLLGRRLLAEHRYAEAATAFGKVGSKVWSDEPFASNFNHNPFDVPVNRQEAAGANSYTPVQFAQRMAELQQQVNKRNGDEAAKLYYELGCGAYNLSWFGNSWILVKRSWSSAELVSTLYGQIKSTERAQLEQQLIQNVYYSAQPAKAFFEQAMKAARQPELAAKACFMAARCEQNELTVRLAIEEVKRGYADFDEKEWSTLTRKLQREQYGRYFSRLSMDYKQTKFQSEILRECATYADYVSHR